MEQNKEEKGHIKKREKVQRRIDYIAAPIVTKAMLMARRNLL